MKEVAGSLASIGSTATSKYFGRLNIVRKIWSAWRKNISAQVITDDDEDDLTNFSDLFIDNQHDLNIRNPENKTEDSNTSIILLIPLR